MRRLSGLVFVGLVGCASDVPDYAITIENKWAGGSSSVEDKEEDENEPDEVDPIEEPTPNSGGADGGGGSGSSDGSGGADEPIEEPSSGGSSPEPVATGGGSGGAEPDPEPEPVVVWSGRYAGEAIYFEGDSYFSARISFADEYMCPIGSGQPWEPGDTGTVVAYITLDFPACAELDALPVAQFGPSYEELPALPEDAFSEDFEIHFTLHEFTVTGPWPAGWGTEVFVDYEWEIVRI